MFRPVILCVGGDARYIYTCEKLCSFGKVYSYGIGGASGDTALLSSLSDMPAKADLLVLPMLSDCGTQIPIFGGRSVPCEDISPQLARNAVVVGGRLNRQVVEYFSALGHEVADYFAREELVIRNCVPTAEGALQIALQELSTTVSGTTTIIVGYGRVAKACARLFTAVGSKVTVCARKLSQLAEAENLGCKAITLDRLKTAADKADIIINTVPAPVITRSVLEKLSKDTLVVDLASKPGGTDFESAKMLGRKVIHALALPGKTAPITSGRIIADAVRNIFVERRE